MRFKGKWTASFIVAAVLCSAGVNDDEAVVTGRVYPERNDDLAWENEFVAFRAYGPKTQRRGERGYGYDIFLKRGTRKPVLDMMYAYQLDPNDERTYTKTTAMAWTDMQWGLLSVPVLQLCLKATVCFIRGVMTRWIYCEMDQGVLRPVLRLLPLL